MTDWLLPMEEETEREAHRRIRRARALQRLDELTTLACREWKDDHHSLESIFDASRLVRAVIGEFEHEANEAERGNPADLPGTGLDRPL